MNALEALYEFNMRAKENVERQCSTVACRLFLFCGLFVKKRGLLSMRKKTPNHAGLEERLVTGNAGLVSRWVWHLCLARARSIADDFSIGSRLAVLWRHFLSCRKGKTNQNTTNLLLHLVHGVDW